MPPTWTVLVFFLTAYDLNIAAIVALGVIGATTGRFILSKYIHWASCKIFNKKQNENLGYLGNRIGKTPLSNFLFTFVYSLTPLSTTALFVAAGIARIRMSVVLAGFFAGRVISYTVLALSTRAIAVNIQDLTHGIFSWKSITSSLLGLIVLMAFIFIDWEELLDKKKLKLNFKIWKWQEN